MTGGPPSICFIVESGTDTRLVEGLARRARLTVLARAIPGGRAVSQPTDVDVVDRASRARRVCRGGRSGELWGRGCGSVLVQGYGLAALAANLAARIKGKPCWMLVCSPVAEYYETRRAGGLSVLAAGADGHSAARSSQRPHRSGLHRAQRITCATWSDATRQTHPCTSSRSTASIWSDSAGRPRPVPQLRSERGLPVRRPGHLQQQPRSRRRRTC